MSDLSTILLRLNGVTGVSYGLEGKIEVFMMYDDPSLRGVVRTICSLYDFPPTLLIERFEAHKLE